MNQKRNKNVFKEANDTVRKKMCLLFKVLGMCPWCGQPLHKGKCENDD